MPTDAPRAVRARDLDLTTTALAEWVKRARADRTQGKTGLTTEERAELAKLREGSHVTGPRIALLVPRAPGCEHRRPVVEKRGACRRREPPVGRPATAIVETRSGVVGKRDPVVEPRFPVVGLQIAVVEFHSSDR
jgi:hypothetical protein